MRRAVWNPRAALKLMCCRSHNLAWGRAMELLCCLRRLLAPHSVSWKNKWQAAAEGVIPHVGVAMLARGQRWAWHEGCLGTGKG